VIKCLGDTLPREAIERPKYKYIEPALACFLEHALKANTFGFAAAILILILLNDLPFLSLTELSQLPALILDILASVAGGNAEVKGRSHTRARF
jgi:hypothetical protein